MNKKRIRTIIVLMSTALAGLIFIQFYWINNAMETESRQFDQQVAAAMNSAIHKLEKFETAGQLAEIFNTASQEKDSFLFRIPGGGGFKIVQRGSRLRIDANMGTGNDTIRNAIRRGIKEGLREGIRKEKSRQTSNATFNYNNDSARIAFRGSWGSDSNGFNFSFGEDHVSMNNLFEPFQQQLADHQKILEQIEKQMNDKARMMENLVVEMSMSQKSAVERIDPANIGPLLTNELHNRGIKTAHAFGIYNDLGDTVVMTSAPQYTKELKNSPYKTALFGDNIYSKPEYLSVHFPHKNNYLLKKMGSVLSLSAVLMLAIIFSFYYTVMTIFRQKKLSDMKTDFINNMTHEFKTPVATILLASEALKDPSVTSDKDRLKRLAGVIYDENKRIGSQVERVLQLAAMEKGEFNLSLTEFDFHDMVNKVADNIAIQVESRNGTIIRELHASKTLTKADELHLSNVLYNLLDNANKYSAGIPEIKITTEDAPGGITLIVEDNGIGMTKEQQLRVFEKFYRVPTGNVHNVKGFGLGLHYVKTIAEMHGGTIKLKSEKNKGSRFEVFLPVLIS